MSAALSTIGMRSGLTTPEEMKRRFIKWNKEKQESIDKYVEGIVIEMNGGIPSPRDFYNAAIPIALDEDSDSYVKGHTREFFPMLYTYLKPSFGGAPITLRTLLSRLLLDNLETYNSPGVNGTEFVCATLLSDAELTYSEDVDYREVFRASYIKQMQLAFPDAPLVDFPAEFDFGAADAVIHGSCGKVLSETPIGIIFPEYGFRSVVVPCGTGALATSSGVVPEKVTVINVVSSILNFLEEAYRPVNYHETGVPLVKDRLKDRKFGGFRALSTNVWLAVLE